MGPLTRIARVAGGSWTLVFWLRLFRAWFRKYQVSVTVAVSPDELVKLKINRLDLIPASLQQLVGQYLSPNMCVVTIDGERGAPLHPHNWEQLQNFLKQLCEMNFYQNVINCLMFFPTKDVSIQVRIVIAQSLERRHEQISLSAADNSNVDEGSDVALNNFALNSDVLNIDSLQQNQELYDVFLSHCGESKVLALQICLFLSVLQVRVWFDRLCIKIGKENNKRIEEGLSLSSKMVCLVDQWFFLKKWPQLEVLSWLSQRGKDSLFPQFYQTDFQDCVGKGPLCSGKPIGTIVKEISSVPPLRDGSSKSEWFKEIATGIQPQIGLFGFDFDDLFVGICQVMQKYGMVFSDSSSGRREFKINRSKVNQTTISKALETLCSMYEFSATITLRSKEAQFESNPEFLESVANKVLDDFVAHLRLAFIRVQEEVKDDRQGDFHARMSLLSQIRHWMKIRELREGSVIVVLGFPMKTLEETLVLDNMKTLEHRRITTIDLASMFHEWSSQKPIIQFSNFKYQLQSITWDSTFDHHDVSPSLDIDVLVPRISPDYIDVDTGIMKAVRYQKQTENFEFDVYVIVDFPLHMLTRFVIMYLQGLGLKVFLRKFDASQKKFDALEVIQGLRSSRWVLLVVSPDTFSLQGSQQISQWEFYCWYLNAGVKDMRVLYVNTTSEECKGRGYSVLSQSDSSTVKVGSFLSEIAKLQTVSFSSSQSFAKNHSFNQLTADFLKGLVSLFSTIKLDDIAELNLLRLRDIVLSVMSFSLEQEFTLPRNCALLHDRIVLSVSFSLFGSIKMKSDILCKEVSKVFQSKIAEETKQNQFSADFAVRIEMQEMDSFHEPLFLRSLSNDLSEVSVLIPLADLIDNRSTILDIFKLRESIILQCQNSLVVPGKSGTEKLSSIDIKLQESSTEAILCSREPVLSFVDCRVKEDDLHLLCSQLSGFQDDIVLSNDNSIPVIK
jgi:hypothetical protein